MADAPPRDATERHAIRFANPSSTVRRLAQALEERVLALARSGDAAPRTWVLGDGDEPAIADRLERERERGDRILVLDWIGTHPDARADVLRRAWALEERCRATGIPVLTLRLGPLIGPRTPLWQKLAEETPRARLARKLVHPVLESDVIETLARAIQGTIVWEGWWELGGPDVLSMAELAALARAAHPESGGEWEPDAVALAEQRLIEPEVWSRWSGIQPGSVLAEAARWAA